MNEEGSHYLRQVDREAQRAVEEEGDVAGDLLAARGRTALRLLREPLQSLLQRACESFHHRSPTVERELLLQNHLLHEVHLVLQLGERVLHVRNHHRHQLREEARLALQDLLSVAHAATQDATQHVAAARVARHRAVRDRHRQRANVVRHHAIPFYEYS